MLGAATAGSEDRYAALRKQLRSFYPDECHGKAKDIRQIESAKKIAGEVIAYTKNNPNYDALDIRRKLYESMRAHFVPFIFTESPFYFEAGVNGGWAGTRPARMAWQLCSRFYKEKNLIPEEAFKVFARAIGRVLPFVAVPLSILYITFLLQEPFSARGLAAFIRRLKTR